MGITSLQEYMNYVDGLTNRSLDMFVGGLFNVFRGQADVDWKLSPNLYRNGLFNAESLLLIHLKRICPEAFSYDRFETLVKMQHYGLPTRLLDVTLNPLVALYFACNLEESKDGCVYVFKDVTGFWQKDPIVDLYMDYIYEQNPENIDLDEVLKKENNKYARGQLGFRIKDVEKLKELYSRNVLLIIPDKTNDRIYAQDGAFFICGMTFEESYKIPQKGKKYYNAAPIMLNNPEDICKTYDCLTIPAAKKQAILDQLNKVGINESYVYPDIEHQIKFTVENVKNRMLKRGTP